MDREEHSPEKAGTGSPGADPPMRTAGALGLAVLAEVDDVTRDVVERWEVGRRPTGLDDEMIRADVAKFAQGGSQEICRFLISGEIPGDAGGSAAAAGWHVANRSSDLADLLKVFLFWRDGLTGVMGKEARKLNT